MARVRFKTKRGRVVSFTTGGRRKKRGRTAQQKLIASAGRACKGTGPIGGKRRTGCLRAYIKKHKRGGRKRR